MLNWLTNSLLQYFICPVSLIHHRGKDVNIPMGKTGDGGPITTQLKTWIGDIMYGRGEGQNHPWGVVVPEEQ